jgi:choline dehydrogenase
VSSIWEPTEVLTPHNNGAEATYFWKSDPRLDTPDLQTILGEAPLCSPEAASQFEIPAAAWTMLAGIVRPESRGRIRLTSNNPQDPIQIDANALSDPRDVRAAIAAVQLSREIAAASALRPFVVREVMPGNLNQRSLENFVRNGAVTLWHPTCTAKMGRDEMSVVGPDLRVQGIANLRIADGSIMPRVTTGNTMAPCVVISERAGDLLKQDWRL